MLPFGILRNTMTQDHQILKHYIGCNVTMNFTKKDVKQTIYGKIMSYDLEKMVITLREAIIYEILFEEIDSFSLRGFSDLSFQDCQIIIAKIYGSAQGWIIDKVDMRDFILLKKEINIGMPIKEYTYPVVLKLRENNNIEVAEIAEDGKFLKPTNYGKIYLELISLGYSIA